MMRRLREHPEWILVGVALVCAVAFANRGAGALGIAITAAALGALAASHGERLPRWLVAPPERVAKWAAYGAVVLVVLWTFWNQLEQRGWMLGDYSSQHAALAQLIPSLEHGRIPSYSLALGTGDSPFETYPVLTYLVAAAASIVTGSDRLVDILVIIGILAHVIVALNIVRIVYRLARPWTAFVIGVVALFDSGSVSGGGLVGSIEWGLIHSALALAFFSFALVAIVDLLARPRLAPVVTVWIATALATATHPSALLAAAGAIVALLVVVLLARGPARRPLLGAAHLGIGAALGAVAWAPLGDRLLHYAQHFSNALRTPAQLLEELLAFSHPPSWFAGVIYAGYVGLVVAIVSRDARKMFLGAAGVIMLLGFLDTAFVQLDLAPSTTSARIGTDRFHALARPFAMIGAGYLLHVVAGHARVAWTGAKRRDRKILGGLLGIAVLLGLRAVVPLVVDLHVRAHELSYRAGKDTDVLRAWAEAEMKSVGPGSYARAFFEDQTGYQCMHVTAETGMSTFQLGATPALLLRERIEDLSPESLRRFNVRWFVERDRSPANGDPATERVIGPWHIREARGWDGQFARVERGAGTVKTLELADERIRVELSGTTAPALVALGMGYYPRWRARDAHGNPIKVYAYPTKPGGKLHVVAAWIPPGATTFTADGPLPSDGKGRGLSLLALLAAAATLVVWTRARWRIKVLRTVARARRLARDRAMALRWAAVAVVALGLVAWGLSRRGEPMRALQAGSLTRGYANLSTTVDGKHRERCSLRRIEGRFRCAGRASMFDTTDVVVNDAQPAWPFTTPAIRLVGDPGQVVEFALRVRRRLAGTYWIGSAGGAVLVEIDGESFETPPQQTRTFADREYTIRISGYAPASGVSLAFVRVDTIEPERSFLTAPPEQAPASLAP